MTLSAPPYPLPLFYASHDGHTRRIAHFIAERLAQRGIQTTLWDLGERQPTFDDMPPKGFPIVLLAAIRYGFHLPPARAFIQKHRPLLQEAPLTMISVNLTARKPHKRTAETNLYLRKWIKRAGLRPTLATAIAGFLDYPRYNLFDRLMIQLIMTMTRGPTDPKARIDFTPWNEVEALADRIGDLYDLQIGRLPSQSAVAS